MRTWIFTIAVIVCTTSIAWAAGGENEILSTPPAPTATNVPDSMAIEAIVQSAAVVAALQRPQATPSWLGDGVCYIWQQPGVALVITNEWHTNTPPPELWISQAKLGAFLASLPNLKRERPPLRITEAEAIQYGDTDELYIEPAVFLLDRSTANERLDMYVSGLKEWMKFNEGMDFLLAPQENLEPVCALVYLDGGGPLEFYFIENEDGSLSLAHIVFYEFFSA